MASEKDEWQEPIRVSVRKVFSLGIVLGYSVSIKGKNIGYVYGYKNEWTFKAQPKEVKVFKRNMPTRTEAVNQLVKFWEENKS